MLPPAEQSDQPWTCGPQIHIAPAGHQPNDHFARQDRVEEQQEWETALLKKIEATIRETFTLCMKAFRITAAPQTLEKSEPPAQIDSPDETEANIEAFLDCF